MVGELWDYETTYALATRQVQLARDAGALTLLPIALDYLANLRMCAGEFAAAAALIEEADTITAAIGNPRVGFCGPRSPTTSEAPISTACGSSGRWSNTESPG